MARLPSFREIEISRGTKGKIWSKRREFARDTILAIFSVPPEEMGEVQCSSQGANRLIGPGGAVDREEG
jgi:hypothetical protein